VSSYPRHHPQAKNANYLSYKLISGRS